MKKVGFKFGLLMMDVVRFENHGSSNIICPEASSAEGQLFAVDGAMPTSRARSALFKMSRPPALTFPLTVALKESARPSTRRHSSSA
ncbi:hypothetical protein SBA1_1800002 [Candidatus Sulfotelmatobacter kueseliae]|uniref:Uncharacterized protein n=1 Tax=Candidatus Sulfotelmatobacter kueseliae TaxID=2042962 RepID=A0A2U3KE12_9BACT|nr:hypothetical protein SBA1_1800002 [Candidatus Sulfotelmatobacter kueseliae]